MASISVFHCACFLGTLQFYNKSFSIWDDFCSFSRPRAQGKQLKVKVRILKNLKLFKYPLYPPFQFEVIDGPSLFHLWTFSTQKLNMDSSSHILSRVWLIYFHITHPSDHLMFTPLEAGQTFCWHGSCSVTHKRILLRYVANTFGDFG